jgi:spermidine/putrescine transport system ATP-binding protein
MTMADTIAVMNRGAIEQMGAPADLYENPRTTFVANFLGQSNLIAGDVVSAAGSRLVVNIEGTSVEVDAARAATTQGRVWVGIRPEKLSIEDVRSPGALNELTGGIVSDVSFVGVSTQYLVRMPWGQELNVFEQNTGERKSFAPGTPVSVRWRPAHAFLLDHAQDALAGVEHERRNSEAGSFDPAKT